MRRHRLTTALLMKMGLTSSRSSKVSGRSGSRFIDLVCLKVGQVRKKSRMEIPAHPHQPTLEGVNNAF